MSQPGGRRGSSTRVDPPSPYGLRRTGVCLEGSGAQRLTAGPTVARSQDAGGVLVSKTLAAECADFRRLSRVFTCPPRPHSEPGQSLPRELEDCFVGLSAAIFCFEWFETYKAITVESARRVAVVSSDVTEVFVGPTRIFATSDTCWLWPAWT
jgi:hypothetical protein